MFANKPEKTISQLHSIQTHGPCISAAVLYHLSYNYMKSHTLGAGQFVGLTLTHERNEKGR